MQTIKVIFFCIVCFSINGQSNLSLYKGVLPDTLFNRNIDNLPDCDFINLYDQTAYKGSVDLEDDSAHVIGKSLIKGCESYSLLWQAPSEITAFDEYKKDSLYFSTRFDGIYIYDKGAIKKLSFLGDALPQEIIKIRFLNDQLFIQTRNEIKQLDLNDLVSTSLIRSDTEIEAFELDAFDQIWIKTEDEIFFNDEYFDSEAVLFSVTKMNQRSQFSAVDNETKLDEGINVFKVGSNFKGATESILYEYKLNDQDWVSGEDAILAVQGFEEGENELIVRMIIKGQNVPAQLFKLTKIKSDTSNSFWKYIIGLLIGLITLLGIAFNRERNIRLGVTQRISRIRAERQLEKTEQKVLQLEMNPHFLFNALNNIKGLIASGKSKEARMYLSKFGSLMRTVLNYSKEEKITINQEMNFLENYLAIEQMSNPEKFDYDIELDDKIDDQKQIPGMIIQPIIENAIIHGVGPKTDKGQISIKFYADEQGTYCSVLDDGLGMESREKESEHKSYAIEIINERLKHAGIKESLKFININELNGNVKGTKVVIKLD